MAKKIVDKPGWQDIKELFTDRIWVMETDFASTAWGKVVRFIKLVRITFDSFAENRMGFQCVALSYFVTLALIPLVAFIFFISNWIQTYFCPFFLANKLIKCYMYIYIIICLA